MTPPMAVNMTDAGKLCSVSRWTIQTFIRQGLPFIATGRKHKLILVSDLEAWLKSRRTVIGGARD